LANKLSKNSLKYSKNGILYNYTTISDKLNEEGLTELLGKFNSMEVNIGLNEPLLEKLAEINPNKSLKDSFNDIINIVDGLFDKTDFVLKNMGKGINLNLDNRMMRQPITRMYDPINYNERASQAAGTFKNKRSKQTGKTRNGKKINKKGTKKRIHKKQKKNTRRN
jgi:hypothetical protein